jgi:hypothetical protein
MKESPKNIEATLYKFKKTKDKNKIITLVLS